MFTDSRNQVQVSCERLDGAANLHEDQDRIQVQVSCERLDEAANLQEDQDRMLHH